MPSGGRGFREKLEEVRDYALHSLAFEKRDGRLHVPAGRRQLLRLRKTRHVAAERNQLTGKQGRVLPLRQLFSKRLRCYPIQALVDLIDAPMPARSFNAVFSPTPATPGTLSEESPVKARKSTICSG